MLALCCFECFFSLNFIHLFLCQCVKKPSYDGFLYETGMAEFIAI
ncbi:hypothetical protein T629_0319 [Acinetobacter baumannii MRSN 3405]|nr:hypothetical protein T629_0319 [Acinetobacter baumannii MRSN 3405]